MAVLLEHALDHDFLILSKWSVHMFSIRKNALASCQLMPSSEGRRHGDHPTLRPAFDESPHENIHSPCSSLKTATKEPLKEVQQLLATRLDKSSDGRIPPNADLCNFPMRGTSRAQKCWRKIDNPGVRPSIQKVLGGVSASFLTLKCLHCLNIHSI